MRNPLIDLIDEEEWKKILAFINDNYNGELYVTDFNTTVERYLKLSFKPKLDDFSSNSLSKLFSILDDDTNPCPFLNFDLIEVKYYCMIQAIKPKVCINWFCEPLNLADSEFNVCVLNFGQEIEYPLCKTCRECGFDEENPRKIGVPTECEKGEGCFHLESRVRYFLRYVKIHPKSKVILQFAKKLIDILKTQNKIYKTLLKTNLDLTKVEINLNLNKYIDLMTDIKRVLGEI